MDRLSQVSEQLTRDNLLTKYRKTSKIAVQDFKETIYGPNWHWRQRGFKYIFDNYDKHTFSHLTEATRKEQRQQSVELMKFYGTNMLWTYEQADRDYNFITLFSNALYSYSPGFCVKNGVHLILYLKTLVILGTDKQKQYIQRAYQHRDIGCFALTEALHGTNVKGLMTEAHYDHQNKQFIIHSPSRDAMKFWIGAAANLANIAVVWAQLYIGEKCYGIHVFIVPLRDEKTHDLLPGILIGDCGPKNGINQVDNGFILFSRVRVPVQNLLNKLSGVDEQGNFYNNCKNQETRFGLQLAALSGGRMSIAMNSPASALNALSIAIRYACTRKQFSAPKQTEQTFLFDYPLTKFRLMPLLAQAVIYQYVGRVYNTLWDKHYKSFVEPDSPMAEQLHSTSSALKAMSSWFASEVITECRQMLGGHGYSSFSRLGSMYHQNDINKTWEGDNTVLLQQTLKFVLEAAQNMTKGKPIEFQGLKFLSNPPDVQPIKPQVLRNLDWLHKVLQLRVSNLVQDTGMKLFELKTKGLEIFDIWNAAQPNYGQPLALAYADLIYFETARKAINHFRSEQNRAVFSICLVLFSLRKIQKCQNYQNQMVIRQTIEILCQELSKQAVNIVDIMAAPSKIIGSCFAEQSGRGMDIYINQVFTAKDAFSKVEWSQQLIDNGRR